MTLQQQYLEAIGIDVWQRRALPVEVTADPAPSEPDSHDTVSREIRGTPVDKNSITKPTVNTVTMDWDTLRTSVTSCEMCPLHTTRTQPVFGIGHQQARLMIIGEAPTKEDDLQGEPFTGRAGQLLKAMLAAIGLKREQVYITNLVKCRPPNDQPPQRSEIDQCSAYLQRQVALVQPAVILVVGEIATRHLLKSDESINVLSDKALHFQDTNIPLISTHHPAFLLQHPAEKRKAWQNLLAVRTFLSASVKADVSG